MFYPIAERMAFKPAKLITSFWAVGLCLILLAAYSDACLRKVVTPNFRAGFKDIGGFLEKQYNSARDDFESLVDNSFSFDVSVAKLLKLVQSPATEYACTLSCLGVSTYVMPATTVASRRLCELLCQGAMAVIEDLNGSGATVREC